VWADLGLVQFHFFNFGQHKITNYKFALQSVHKQHPCPREQEEPFHGEKTEETFRRATEEDLSPGWTGAIDVTFTEGSITEVQHIQLI